MFVFILYKKRNITIGILNKLVELSIESKYACGELPMFRMLISVNRHSGLQQMQLWFERAVGMLWGY